MKLLNLLMIGLICGQTYAQRPGDMTQGVLNELIPFNNSVKQLYGNSYLFSDWSKGKIAIKHKGKLKEYNPLDLRYDLANQHVEVKFKNSVSGQESVKVFNDLYLQKFEYQNQETKKIDRFERCKNFKTEKPMIGFFKILYSGKKVQLLAQHTSYIQKGNEFKTLGIGSANERVIKKIAYYITKGGKTYKIKRRRKSILAQFGSKKAEVKSFARENNLYYKSAEDLTAIFKYYDGLK